MRVMDAGNVGMTGLLGEVRRDEAAEVVPENGLELERTRVEEVSGEARPVVSLGSVQEPTDEDRVGLRLLIKKPLSPLSGAQTLRLVIRCRLENMIRLEGDTVYRIVDGLRS